MMLEAQRPTLSIAYGRAIAQTIVLAVRRISIYHRKGKMTACVRVGSWVYRWNNSVSSTGQFRSTPLPTAEKVLEQPSAG